MDDSHRFTSTYRGKILDTSDPEELGRCKIEIYPMLIGIATAKNFEGVDGIAVEQLPWALPAMPLFTGAGLDHGSFCVPEVDSFVFVFFVEGDINQPVYFAEAPTKLHGLPSERTTNYPDRRVFKTPSGIVIYIDDSNGDMKITQPTGTSIQISANGNVTLISVGNITITGSTVRINP